MTDGINGQEFVNLVEFMGEPQELRDSMKTVVPAPIDASDFCLHGKVVFITGGGSGLGKAYAQAMAKLGMKVAIAGRDPRKLHDVERLIHYEGGEGRAFVMDVGDFDSVRKTVESIETCMGPIEVLINNAATEGPVMPWWQAVNSGEWEKTLLINYEGTLYCTALVSERMHLRNRGRVVNIASSTVVSRPEPLAIYAYSKWKVVQLTRQLAKGFRESGLSIFAVHPGTIWTPMTERLKDKVPTIKHIFDTHQDAKEESAVELILYLASGAADHLSGEFICRKEGTIVNFKEGL